MAFAAGCTGGANLLAPRCISPAPLLGQLDPTAPGYIVVFHDQVDAAAETRRLAANYGFTPAYIYTAALNGFSANLRSPVVAALRCEPSVAFVEYDAMGGISWRPAPPSGAVVT
jgi:hypothetical protein